MLWAYLFGIFEPQTTRKCYIWISKNRFDGHIGWQGPFRTSTLISRYAHENDYLRSKQEYFRAVQGYYVLNQHAQETKITQDTASFEYDCLSYVTTFGLSVWAARLAVEVEVEDQYQ